MFIQELFAVYYTDNVWIVVRDKLTSYISWAEHQTFLIIPEWFVEMYNTLAK